MYDSNDFLCSEFKKYQASRLSANYVFPLSEKGDQRKSPRRPNTNRKRYWQNLRNKLHCILHFINLSGLPIAISQSGKSSKKFSFDRSILHTHASTFTFFFFF